MDEVEPNQHEVNHNLGQITRELGQYLRVCLRCEPAICAPHPYPSPHEVKIVAKINSNINIKPLIVDIS